MIKLDRPARRVFQFVCNNPGNCINGSPGRKTYQNPHFGLACFLSPGLPEQVGRTAQPATPR